MNQAARKRPSCDAGPTGGRPSGPLGTEKPQASCNRIPCRGEEGGLVTGYNKYYKKKAFVWMAADAKGRFL